MKRFSLFLTAAVLLVVQAPLVAAPIFLPRPVLVYRPTHARVKSYALAAITWRGQVSEQLRALSASPCQPDPALLAALNQMNANLAQVLGMLQNRPGTAAVTDPALIAVLNQLNANQQNIIALLNRTPGIVTPGPVYAPYTPAPLVVTPPAATAQPMMLYHYHYWVGPLLPQGTPTVPSLVPGVSPGPPLVPAAPSSPLTPPAPPVIPLVPPAVPSAPLGPPAPPAMPIAQAAPVEYSHQPAKKTALYRPQQKR